MLSGRAMETTTRLLLPDVSAALRTDPQLVVEMTEELHPADLADLCAALDDELAILLIRALPVEEGARLLEAMAEDRRSPLIEQLVSADSPRTAELVEEMAPDEAADLVAELPEATQAALFEQLEPEESRDLRQLMAYPEHTAGSLMTTNFVTVAADMTVVEAIETIRREAAEMETIANAYAVDPNGTLLGVVSLRDLVLARADKKINDIMEPHVIAVADEDPDNEVVRIAAKYDLIAVPVLDRNRRIVGIITVDDVVDVIEEKADEEMQRVGAVAPLEDTYFQTSFTSFVIKRAPWLVFLFVAGFATSAAMKSLTDTFDKIGALLWFVPLIISSGGNAGSQSATLMIRALAVEEVKPADFARVIARELIIGLALGLVLAVFGIGRAMAWTATRTLSMAATVSLSILVVVTIGSMIGAGLPLLLKRAGMDPAVSSTPFIASLSDVMGLLIYYEIAKSLVL
jgi:magnesium transporter